MLPTTGATAASGTGLKIHSTDPHKLVSIEAGLGCWRSAPIDEDTTAKKSDHPDADPTRVARPRPTATAAPSLVAGTDEVMAEMSASRARGVTLAIALIVVFGFTLVHANPNAFWRWAGAASLAAILAVAIGTRRAILGRRDPTWHRNRANRIALVGFICAAPLAFFFGPYGNMAPVGALLLLAYNLRAPAAYGIAATIAIAVPHGVAVVLDLTGVLQKTGMHLAQHYVPGKAISGAQSMIVYALGTWVGRLIQNRSSESLREIQTRFRQVTEREALLREARLDIERAAGVGQEGRFTGERFGRFRLGLLLGRGGMGEIYEAVDRNGDAAAVKVLRGGRGEGALQRFEREAHFSKAVSSPHVVRVLEVGTTEQHVLPFLAMERMHGEDLSQMLLSQLRLSLREAADMAMQIASGLDAAHDAGVVHQDIKPDNLFRTGEGVWKILDFGVAQSLDETMAASAHGIAGTPGYMAPEQLNEDALIDHRTDIHALGAVLYRAITGQPAFPGRDARSTLRRVRRSLPLAPSQVVPIPMGIDVVLRIALAKDPADRFASARELAVSLRDAINRPTIPAKLAARAEALNRKLGWK